MCRGPASFQLLGGGGGVMIYIVMECPLTVPDRGWSAASYWSSRKCIQLIFITRITHGKGRVITLIGPCRLFGQQRVQQQEHPHGNSFKGTVRPDWICTRVVSLESPLKAHQPVYVFNFFISLLNILKDFKVLSHFMQNWIQSSCLFGSRFACAQAAIFFAKPYSINAGEASIVLWIAAR